MRHKDTNTGITISILHAIPKATPVADRKAGRKGCEETDRVTVQ